MSTLSPHNNHGDQGDQGASSNSYSGDSPRSPLNLNLGFLKGLADRKTTRDGQPAKRRGPKPDSKPALTRRQELNRQAQRTHRERKEVYIKALEEQVGRLKETFSVSSQEKNSIKEENQKLKELLRIHGIPYHSSNQSGQSLGPGPDSWGGNSAGSQYGGYNLNAQSFSPPTTSFSSDTPPSMHEAAKAGNELIGGPQRMHQQPGMDHDQLGIDFVLTLERPCMAHTQFMCVRSTQGLEPEPQISGHALMATCPPYSHIVEKPDVPFPYKSYDIPNSDLLKLLDLSQSLPLNGEITPVQALKLIRSHERYGELTPVDFGALIDELKGKPRCYGFGAVLEEFEVRDALNAVFATKPETYANFF